MITEIDSRPLGDTILDGGLTDWPEAKACWVAKCPSSTCTRALYDMTETGKFAYTSSRQPTNALPEIVRVIRDCINGLPNTI